MNIFEHANKKIDLITDGCFQPNLTTRVILSAAINQLSNYSNNIDNIIEIGCGCGVISTYLMYHSYIDNIQYLGLSDLSEKAIEISKLNIGLKGNLKKEIDIHFKIGSGLTLWKDENFDMVINDISALSEAIVPMNNWFDNAPNNSGIDGIENTKIVLEEFNSIANKGAFMLFPVLSLSNTKLLFSELGKLPLEYERLSSQAWPLPAQMVEKYYDELCKLRDLEHINFETKFGQCIAKTECYKVWKT